MRGEGTFIEQESRGGQLILTESFRAEVSPCKARGDVGSAA